MAIINRGSRRTRGESRLVEIVVRGAKRIFLARKQGTPQPSKEDSHTQAMAEIYLKGGESVWLPYTEADEYVAANEDKLEYRKVETRRPRVKTEESQL